MQLLYYYDIIVHIENHRHTVSYLCYVFPYIRKTCKTCFCPTLQGDGWSTVIWWGIKKGLFGRFGGKKRRQSSGYTVVSSEVFTLSHIFIIGNIHQPFDLPIPFLFFLNLKPFIFLLMGLVNGIYMLYTHSTTACAEAKKMVEMYNSIASIQMGKDVEIIHKQPDSYLALGITLIIFWFLLGRSRLKYFLLIYETFLNIKTTQRGQKITIWSSVKLLYLLRWFLDPNLMYNNYRS